MIDPVLWDYSGSHGSVELEWYAGTGVSLFEQRPTASIRVDEPYRETSGHSARITPEAARELAAKLIEFADAVDEQFPASSRESVRDE